MSVVLPPALGVHLAQQRDKVEPTVADLITYILKQLGGSTNPRDRFGAFRDFDFTAIPAFVWLRGAPVPRGDCMSNKQTGKVVTLSDSLAGRVPGSLVANTSIAEEDEDLDMPSSPKHGGEIPSGRATKRRQGDKPSGSTGVLDLDQMETCSRGTGPSYEGPEGQPGWDDGPFRGKDEPAHRPGGRLPGLTGEC